MSHSYKSAQIWGLDKQIETPRFHPENTNPKPSISRMDTIPSVDNPNATFMLNPLITRMIRTLGATGQTIAEVGRSAIWEINVSGSYCSGKRCWGNRHGALIEIQTDKRTHFVKTTQKLSNTLDQLSAMYDLKASPFPKKDKVQLHT